MSSSTEPQPEKKIHLRSSDGESFEIGEVVALESVTIKHMIEDGCADTIIPLPNVTAKILSKVIEYCSRHVAVAEGGVALGERVVDDELKAFDKEFVNVDQHTLFELILAANYLNIKNLLDLTCQTVADSIKDKSVEEVRKIFNIENDYTEEEEEEIRKEYAWAFK